MRYSLFYLLSVLLTLGCVPVALAQAWQMPNPDLGVPKPQGPRIPTLGNLSDDQQARTRAQNAALIAEQERYSIEKARQEQDLHHEIRDFQAVQQNEAQAREQFKVSNQQRYENAYQTLQAMLEGKRQPSLRQAVFVVESTFLNGQIVPYSEFSAHISDLAQLCQGLAGDSARATPTTRFLSLHRLMTDTVRTSYAGKVVSVHLPYRYDFNDFRGEQDYRQMFVSKLLATGSGQCHSLPLLYKLIADELGVKTYISMAPNHTYIQVKDAQGVMHRYETTNGRFVTDSYYMSTGYIKVGALKRHVYLDTLTQRELIAYQLQDLAGGYAWRYGDDDFTAKCAALALKHYPHSMQARLIGHNAALARFARAWQTAGSPPPEKGLQLPQLQLLWAAVQKWQRGLQEWGFEEMPKEQYNSWLNSLEAEKARQESGRAAARFQAAR